MQDKRLAHSAMFISVALFAVIGYIDHYTLLAYHGIDGPILRWIYGFFMKFGPLHQKYLGKLLLLMAIVAAVMLYHPKKIAGKTYTKGVSYLSLGIIFFGAGDALKVPNIVLYWSSVPCYFLGFLFSLSGSVHLFQVLSFTDLSKEDPFNDGNETFQQMEQKIDTPYSVNIPYDYRFKGKIRKGWVNFVNLFRALLIIGTPGSGKSFALFEEIIEQLIGKMFTLLIYDFKFDTLSRIAYNHWLKKKEQLGTDDSEQLGSLPGFYTISFDDPERTHRNNPISPYLMKSQIDASDAATIIMKNLNKEWIKQNDFFSRSAISFVSGLIWYLKKKAEETGTNICTLPHVIILSTVNIQVLLDIILRDMEVRNLMIPFKDALEREAGQQLAGQTASAQISLSMLATKEIFYVMTGNDFQLDINSTSRPKIVCVQNNPDRSEIYAAPIGLIINKALQVVNRPGGRPMGVILDEVPTIFIMGLRKIIDTGRSHLVATVLGIQSVSQLIADYGKELADVIFDNCANVFSGAAKGETARRISDIFGKIHQEKLSRTVSRNDTTTSMGTQMMELMPKSKITGMSTGYFGGIVADTFEHPIKQKLCFGLLRPNMEAKKHQDKFPLPITRDFRTLDHDKKVGERLALMEDIGFFDKVARLDLAQNDYIEFYNVYLETFTKENCDGPMQRMQFTSLVRDLKLYDHLKELGQLVDNKGADGSQIRAYMENLVGRMFLEREMERVLDEAFHKVLGDIDDLVKDEYFKIKGEHPKSSIFDPDKITDEIGASLDANREIALEFLEDFNQMSGPDLFEDMDGSQERPTFKEDNSKGESLADPWDGADLFEEEPYSSYPVQNL
ncbi:TraM recognition domain-containing protein [Flagellimonas marinaquae]|nr:TraM recognition domain-containing protein [Allomuricauda aquimarina]